MAKLIEAIEKRRAYRALSVEAPSDEVVERIMKAAVFAPSCSNKQPWRFLVARNEAAREKVAEALADGNYWAKGAPLFVLAITKPELDCRLKDRRDYALFDTGMAAMNLQLQAVNEGLRAHPMRRHCPEEKLRDSRGIHPGNCDRLGISGQHRYTE